MTESAHPVVQLEKNSLARSRLLLGDACVDIGRLSVVGRGEAGKLAPKSLGVLIEMARYPGQTVTRAELLDRVWPDTNPTPDVLSHAVRELRRALGDDARAPRYIQTVHGLGYRLLVPVSVEDNEPGERRAEASNDAAPPDVAAAPADVPSPEAAPASIAAATPGQATEPHAPRAAPAPPARRMGAAPWVAAVVLVLAFVVLGRILDLAPRAQTTEAWTARLATSDAGAEEFPKLSPDGETLLFTRRDSIGGRWDLRRMRVDGSASEALSDTPDEDELWPVWSPDATRVAFVHLAGNACDLQVMPAGGGERRSLAPCDRVVFSAIDWSPDGRHLLTSLPSQEPGNELRVQRIPVDGGAPEPLVYRVGRPGWDRDPVYSPDGRSIAFRRGLPPDYDVFLMPAEGGQARRLTRIGTVGEGLAWMPDGRELLLWSNHEGASALYRLDVASGELRPTHLDNATRPSVARNGTRLAFQRPWFRVGLLALDVRDADAAPVPLSESTGSVGAVAGSADRTRLAYVSDRGGFQQVWIHEPGQPDRAYGDETLRHVTSLDWSDDGNTLLLVARHGEADHALQLDLGLGTITELGLSAPLLRDAVGSAEAGRIYAIVHGDERPMLARFDRRGDAWHETRSEIPATELIRVPGVPGVFGRTPLRSNVVVHVGEDLALREIALQPRVYGWTAADGAIWYISTVARAKAELRRYDLASGEDRGIRPLPHYFPRRRAGIAKLGDEIVVAVLVEDSADVGVVELPR